MQNSTLEKEVIELIGSRYTDLSASNRGEFLKLYEKKSKNIIAAYIFWFFSLHYLYFYKWFVFIIFIITLMGLGFWWVIDLFRIDTILNRYNKELAIEIINNLEIKNNRGE